MDESITYNELQSNLEASLDKVAKGHTPLLVKREKGKDIVIMSEEDYASMEETMHLLRSPKNAEQLKEALVYLLLLCYPLCCLNQDLLCRNILQH